MVLVDVITQCTTGVMAGSYRVLVQGSGFHLIWPSSDGGFTFSLDHPLGLDEGKVWAQQYEDEAAAPLYSVW